MKKNRKGFVVGLVVGGISGAMIASKMTRNKVEVQAMTEFLENLEKGTKARRLRRPGKRFGMDITEDSQDFALGKIAFDSWEKAETIINHLEETIDRYGNASVQDMFDFMSEGRYSPQAFKYGWTDLDGTSIITRKGKYYIEFRPYHKLERNKGWDRAVPKKIQAFDEFSSFEDAKNTLDAMKSWVNEHGWDWVSISDVKDLRGIDVQLPYDSEYGWDPTTINEMWVYKDEAFETWHIAMLVETYHEQ